jgi:hypothetical protein
MEADGEYVELHAVTNAAVSKRAIRFIQHSLARFGGAVRRASAIPEFSLRVDNATSANGRMLSALTL